METNKISEIEVSEAIELAQGLRRARTKFNEDALKGMENALEFLRAAKPDERGELARRYAVTITDFEKTIAYFTVYVVE